MKYPTPISPKTHGLIDYTTSAAVAAAPKVLHMSRRGAAVTYGLAAGLAGLTLMSKTPVSAKGIVPFKAHGATDVVLGAALPFVPRMLGLENRRREGRRMRAFFGGLAGMIGLVALMTDWRSTGAHTQAPDA